MLKYLGHVARRYDRTRRDCEANKHLQFLAEASFGLGWRCQASSSASLKVSVPDDRMAGALRSHCQKEAPWPGLELDLVSRAESCCRSSHFG